GLLAGAAGLAEPAIGAPDPATPPEEGYADPSFSVLHGLYWLSSNLAERTPLLIAVDDAQWSDPASLRFLDYLVGRLEGLPVLLAIGIRPAEPGSAEELLGPLYSEAASHVQRLAPL